VIGVKHHFQQYFSYIVVVSFIGGRNRNTQRKPPTCRKSITHLQLANSGIRTHNFSDDRDWLDIVVYPTIIRHDHDGHSEPLCLRGYPTSK